MYSDDRPRGGASAHGYDARWREARAIFLKQHPLCAFCQAEGKLVPATVVDHIIPHGGDRRLFWDQKTGNPSARNVMIGKPEAGCDAASGILFYAA